MSEIAGQPDALRRAARRCASDPEGFERIGRLAQGRTVILTGMGSSYDACYPAVAELARAGLPAIHVDAAELLHFRPGLLPSAPLLVAVSQSGESAEVVLLARRIRELASPGPLIAVTNGIRNPLAELADVVVDTAAGPETGPSTMTFGGALVAMRAVTSAITGSAASDLDGLEAQAALAGEAIQRLLDDRELPGRLRRWNEGRASSVILGRGPARAASEMGALTIKEAVGVPIESIQTAQFRHGPLELVGPSLAALIVATEPETVALDLRLAEELHGAGASVLAVVRGPEVPAGVDHVSIGSVDRMVAPAVSVVPSQLFAWTASIERGREPGSYYRASKVTTRE